MSPRYYSQLNPLQTTNHTSNPVTSTSKSPLTGVHATSSSQRITSPMIIIPGHEPLKTSLNPQQLADLLPTLHTYVDAHTPSLALLPAVGISYAGLLSALRWREADIGHRNASNMRSTLPRCIEMYQALAALGNKLSSRTLWLLNRMIQAELNTPLSLSEFRYVWSLRTLPYTERFVSVAVAQLSRTYVRAANASQMTYVQADVVPSSEMEGVLTWVNQEPELVQKIECMQLQMGLKAKRERVGRRKRPQRARSAVKLFKTTLTTVSEEVL